jgi:hypothetical protein
MRGKIGREWISNGTAVAIARAISTVSNAPRNLGERTLLAFIWRAAAPLTAPHNFMRFPVLLLRLEKKSVQKNAARLAGFSKN